MRRVRRKGGNKEKVFGCDLLEHLTASSQEIPLVLRCCSEFVEKHGIVDGIYRLSGVSSNIQKLRGEFESDGSPDLNKDLYLQDIHCVSSLCKAYFRELPNPLLTYQLYDKFAEAVAIQLEEERLVKIRDVLKELPTPHYRTLEFLMRHLVRMASYSSETNMHARNLAIVWAPNLLRSKDIEASGFNGTAAFMEVRVQSIVVEFILTHVPQLFPEKGVSHERRSSLPSPTAACAPDEGFFKVAHPQPVPNFGNISPGDGPLPIRPYHAIIEGTDKRKGSLKGRKWMSIFNIGGRFPDPRRRHKHSAKEKERAVLRPARSMDSLSAPNYLNEGSRRSAQRPPSTNMSAAPPLVTPSPQPGSNAAPSPGALGGSEYAVTYRRGTGLVSGGAGTQGTYTVLDPDGSGVSGSECQMSRSPGQSTKVGRRAAMHITGPTMVTVPLHIHSNLALVLQGGGGDRVVHCGRDKNVGDKAEEGGDKMEKKKSRGVGRQVEEGRKAEEEEKNHREKVTHREGVVEAEVDPTTGGGGGKEEEEEESEGKKEEEKEEEEEVREECRLKPETLTGGQSESREQRARSVTSNTEEGEDEEADEDNKDVDDSDEYMEMKGVRSAALQPKVTQHSDDSAFDASDILNSTEVEEDDLQLSGYVQDNFDFLDQMDCSVHDHMDCSVSYQVNEFSVEPPGHSDDEYEIMEQAQSPRHPAEVKTHPQSPGPETHTTSPTELNPHRPLSLDVHSRHTKSLSLPYMTSPVHGPEDSCSEEDAAEDDSDDDEYSSEEDDSMFMKSLPPDFFLNSLSRNDPDADTQHGCTLQSSEEREVQSTNPELPAAGDQEQLQNNKKSKVSEEDRGAMDDTESDKEQPLTSESPTNHCAEFPMQSDDESRAEADVTVEREKEEVVDETHGGRPPGHAGSHADAPVEESRESEHVGEDSDEGEVGKMCNETEDSCKEEELEIKENDGNTQEDTAEEGNKVTADKEDEEKMQEGEMCEIWGELEDVICEVIEDEESEQAGKEKGERGSDSLDGDTIRDGEEEEQMATFSGEGELETDGGGADETEVRIEEEEESLETEEKLTDSGTENETNSPKTCDEASQEKLPVNDRAQLHDREEENNDKERASERRRTPPRADKHPKEGGKCEESAAARGGVGRKLVVSKNPKVYQVKAVPVVPPKPQHCKITALTLRQQQQQRERRDAERGRESAARDGEDGDEGVARRERRRDGDDGATRDTNRNSPLSMCFDEAVAIATMRREKEKECEKEKERQRDWGNDVQ